MTVAFADDLILSTFFMSPPLVEEQISIRRDRSLSFLPEIAFISLKLNWEKGPGADLCPLVRFSAPIFVGTPSANVISSIPTLSKSWWSWMSRPPWVLLL